MSSAWWICEVRNRIETGIDKWVKSLNERGMLNGALTEQDELAEYIIKEFEGEEQNENR